MGGVMGAVAQKPKSPCKAWAIGGNGGIRKSLPALDLQTVLCLVPPQVPPKKINNCARSMGDAIPPPICTIVFMVIQY